MTEDHMSIRIVPSQKWADELRKRGVPLGEEIFTPVEFLRSRCNPPLPVISKNLSLLLTLAALNTAKTSYFQKSSVASAKIIRSAIGKLKRNRITTDELATAIETRGGLKEGDLFKVYSEYEGLLKEKGFLDEDSLFLLAEPFPDSRDITFVGFDEPLPYMEILFRGRSLVPSFCHREEAEGRRGDPVGPSGHSGLLRRIAPRNDTIFELNSPLTESHFIANTIIDLINKGTKPDEIAIFDPTGGEFISDIARYFEKKLNGNITYTPFLKTLISREYLPENALLSQYLDAIERTECPERPVSEIATQPYSAGRMVSQIGKLNSLIESFRSAIAILNLDPKLSFEDIKRLFDDELKTPSNLTTLPFIPAGIQDIGLYDVKYAFLPRCNDGIVPSPGGDIFFSEPDTLAPTKDERFDRIFKKQEDILSKTLIKFKFLQNCNTVVTFTDYDEHGNEISPSVIIANKASKKIFKKIVPQKFSGEKKCGSIIKSPDAVAALNERTKDIVHSATKLEEYATCPFSYFVRYILGIEAPDEESPDILPRERGTLIHSSLELFFVNNRNYYINNLSAVTSTELYPLVKASIEEAFTKNKDILTKFNPELLERQKLKLAKMLVTILVNEAKELSTGTQRPEFFELRFEEELVKGLKVRGSIDRIDTDATTFTILDYKSGKIDSVKNGIDDGTELQMPLYTAAAERVLKKEPAAAFLYSTGTKERKTGIVKKELKEHLYGKNKPRLAINEEEWERLINKGLETALLYAENIKKGLFEAAPKKCPAYCGFKEICRYMYPPLLD